jgi:hypothetical protein
LQNFPLAAAEKIDRVLHVFSVVAEHGVRHSGAEIAIASCDCPHGINKIGIACLLEQITPRASAEDLSHVDRIPMHAEGEGRVLALPGVWSSAVGTASAP